MPSKKMNAKNRDPWDVWDVWMVVTQMDDDRELGESIKDVESEPVFLSGNKHYAQVYADRHGGVVVRAWLFDCDPRKKPTKVKGCKRAK